MSVKVFILDANGRLFDVVGEIGNFDGGSILFSVDFIKQFSISIEDLGADGGWAFRQFSGIGNIFEKKNGVKSQEDNQKTR